jgi:hypothetical protein
MSSLAVAAAQSLRLRFWAWRKAASEAAFPINIAENARVVQVTELQT